MQFRPCLFPQGTSLAGCLPHLVQPALPEALYVVCIYGYMVYDYLCDSCPFSTMLLLQDIYRC